MVKNFKNLKRRKKFLTIATFSGFMKYWMAVLVSLHIFSYEVLANEINLDFKYTVVAASCNLQVPPTHMLGVDGHLSPDSLIGQEWNIIGQDNINIILSGCTGTPDKGMLPRIQVTPAGGTTLSHEHLFRDSSKSESEGFGIVVGNKAEMTSLDVGSLINQTNDGSEITLNQSGPAANQGYNIRVGVACGSKADCAAEKLKPGKLEASIILDFKYR
ncbi:hypothetical protein [Enterobacter cloacae]|uniref:hypothetical protein n=1 Tax=Enterobacter cloacae TaxID=550 RepID=UPI0013CFABDA|nr:hypothetical protein [Enterobacter cloacae]